MADRESGQRAGTRQRIAEPAARPLVDERRNRRAPAPFSCSDSATAADDFHRGLELARCAYEHLAGAQMQALGIPYRDAAARFQITHIDRCGFAIKNGRDYQSAA